MRRETRHDAEQDDIDALNRSCQRIMREEEWERLPLVVRLENELRGRESMNNVEKRLAEIRERCDAATPEPWLHRPGVLLKEYVYSQDEEFGFSLQHLHWDDGHETNAVADAEFVAHARSDIPWLLDLVTTYRTALREMVCPDCDGNGVLGQCSDGRMQSCEMCGGHGDARGSGLNPAWREIRDKALEGENA